MKKQLISAFTAAAMLSGISASAITAQASPRLAPYRNVLNAFQSRVTEGFSNYADEDDITYGVLLGEGNQFSYLWYHGYTELTTENTAACLVGLNGDGTEELLLGVCDDQGGWSLLDLYTLSGGKVHHLAATGERDHFSVLRSGKIAEEGSSGAANSCVNIYTIGADRLVPDIFYQTTEKGFFMTTEIELKEDLGHQYYSVDDANWQTLSQTEYMTQTECLTAALPFLPLSQYNDEIFISQSATLGDFNDDGVINAGDAADVLIFAAELGAGGQDDLTDAQFYAADTDSDGQINASDAANILEYAAYVGAGGDATFYLFLTQGQ